MKLRLKYRVIYYAFYYHVLRDYEKEKYYLLLAVKDGNKTAMNDLAIYYWKVERDYDKMKEWFGLAIEKDSTEAMFNLALYYETVEKNWELMEKYHLMAAERGVVQSMENLAIYYYDIVNDYEKMRYYDEMAAEKGSVIALQGLAIYYEEIQKDIEKMKYYHVLAAKKGRKESQDELYIYYKDNPKDLSFVRRDIWPALEKLKETKLIKLIQPLLSPETQLPKGLYTDFLAINLSNISTVLTNKQYVLRMTSIWPRYCTIQNMYTFNNLIYLTFMSNHLKMFPKELLLLIAGKLFSTP